MNITLAYSNDQNETEDYTKLATNGKLILFTLDIANVSSITKIKGTSFRWSLLDAGIRTLKSRYRVKGNFTTKPDMLLNGEPAGVVVQGKKVINSGFTYEQLLTAWFFARSKWLACDSLYTTGLNSSDVWRMLKVEPSDDEFTFSQLANISSFQSGTFNFESVYAYDESNLVLKASGAIAA